MAGELRIGTSGYSYEDWRGCFYPVKLAKKDMLAYYAQEFSFTEINSTYYQLPGLKMMEGLAQKTPGGFVFTVKAYQSLTHGRTDTVEEDARKFIYSLAPLREAGKLGAVLLQFPYSFHNREENRTYLARLKDILRDAPTIVEFRNQGWDRPAVLDFLKQLQIGYTCVDEPQLKGLVKPCAVSTWPLSYVRFHGRNAAKWWQPEQSFERYDYTYSPAELEEWVPGIEKLREESAKVFVAFNNHYRAQAVLGARMLRDLLQKIEG